MSRVPPGRLVAPRPAGGRARSPRTTAFAPSLAWSLVLALAGCAPAVPTASAAADASTSPVPRTSDTATLAAPTPSARPTSSAGSTPAVPSSTPTGPDLLLLAFEGEAASLQLIRLSGTVIPVALPDPSAAAVVPIAGGRLVAVLRDGRAFVARRGPAGLASGTGWRALTLRGSVEMPPGAFVWSATASPDGSRVAAIARPGDAQSPSALVIIDPARGQREVHPLADETEGVPPAWVDGERLVIVQRDRFDRVFLAIVAVATGQVTDRLQLRALEFGTSGDGRTAAALGEGGVVVGPAASVLALRRLPESGPTLPAADRVSGGLSLSEDGRFVAIVVQDGDAGPSSLAIYQQVGGAWRIGPRIAQGAGLAGGWPTWLP